MQNEYGTKGYARKGVVIHNDAGSKNATAKSYEYLRTADYDRLARGFAHMYIDEHDRVSIVPDDQVAWHTATFEGNEAYVGVEVCQSMGDEQQFRRNEEATFRWVAEYMIAHGMTPNWDTVKLHKEFSSTSCPHRSWELHGNSVESVRNYFIERINAHMTDILHGGGVSAPAPTTPQDNKDWRCPRQNPNMDNWELKYPNGVTYTPYTQWLNEANYVYRNANPNDTSDKGTLMSYFEGLKWVTLQGGIYYGSDGEDVCILSMDGTTNVTEGELK